MMTVRASTLAFLIMLSTSIVFGGEKSESSKTITFQNQREEIFDLENFLKETRYRKETVDSTCYKQEQYTENVCRNVTRHREECRTIPGHQDCRIVNDQVCRTEDRYENVCRWERGEPICRVVVRYRQECSTSGGGRQCRTIPGSVECHRAPNGENRCVKIPPREECTSSPGERICRNVPYEERECTEGPGRQVCHTERRPERVCQNVPRQECVWIPDRVACQQIPYEERVCKDEVKYRQIPYACKKEIDVPYEVTLLTHKAQVKVDFNTNATQVASQYQISLNSNGNLNLKAQALKGNKPVVFMKKNISSQTSGDINQITANYKLNLLDTQENFSWLDKGIQALELHKRSLSFLLQGKIDQARSKLFVKIEKGDELRFEKLLSSQEFKATFDGVVTRVDVDLKALGAGKLGGVFNKTYTVTLKLVLDYSDLGDIVLPQMGEISTGVKVDIERD